VERVAEAGELGEQSQTARPAHAPLAWFRDPRLVEVVATTPDDMIENRVAVARYQVPR